MVVDFLLMKKVMRAFLTFLALILNLGKKHLRGENMQIRHQNFCRYYEMRESLLVKVRNNDACIVPVSDFISAIKLILKALLEKCIPTFLTYCLT
jgi:hypothetical protein